MWGLLFFLSRAGRRSGRDRVSEEGEVEMVIRTDDRPPRILLPTVPARLVQGNPVRLTHRSPLPLRRAVYYCALNFRREFSYDFVQYGYKGRDSDPHHVAFLWLDLAHPRQWAVGPQLPAVGACCFRLRRGYRWALQW